eukprot:CAMPEP_0172609368 /NCGR_PEP_ID=MMETSP1068-20121228/29374_1 /TAXON_ID=35684 /ORGANISM="Pseudopedinella elastica, Strain CCMP716" /LENGTH=272 /DNA_ID=CAMNT_0013412867 /DNA_START=18 /DNA_END=833 /DNA_ORIENTATION=+
MIPRLPMAPPALANASVMHGARIRRRRLPSHDLIEVMHASAELIHERIAADALVATFCALEGATVQATLVFTHSLMSLSAEISGGLLPGKQNGGVLPFRSLTDPPGMHSVVAMCSFLFLSQDDKVAEMWGHLSSLLSETEELMKHGAALPKLWSDRERLSAAATQRGLYEFIQGFLGTLSGLTARRDSLARELNNLTNLSEIDQPLQAERGRNYGENKPNTPSEPFKTAGGPNTRPVTSMAQSVQAEQNAPRPPLVDTPPGNQEAKKKDKPP